MRDFKCAVFDLDGTLLDSTLVWSEVDENFFNRRGLTQPPGYAKAISPMGFERAAVYTIERFNLKETPEQVMAEWNDEAQRMFASRVFLKPGAAEYLELLKQKGVKLCIATASHRELFVPALQNNGVFHLFDYITTLKEVKRGKGFPDIYLESAKKAGESVEDCVVFEDLYEGIKGSKAGGFYTVAVYDKNSEDDTEKIKSISDKFIYDFNELI